MDSEVVAILKEIRDEAKQSNVRLESLGGRVEFLEKRVSKGFEVLTSRLDEQAKRQVESETRLVEFLEERVSKGFEVLTSRLDEQAKRQVESETRLATEVVALADLNRQVRDLLSEKLDDHHMVLEHETRISLLEVRVPNHPSD